MGEETMTRPWRLARAARSLLPVLLLVAACAPAPVAPAKPTASPTGPAVTSAPTAAAAPGKPELATTPTVNLKVGVVPLASFGPFFIAQERGYFEAVGLNVELSSAANLLDQLPALAQGQLHVSTCSSSVGCFNALNRRTDVQIVASLASAGKTPKSTGNNALVVRKDLWDNGTIREPRDLVGRSIYVNAPGAGHQAQAARWLRSHGVDPMSVEWEPIAFADQLAAMQNRAIEVGVQTEPLISAGLARGVLHILATQEEMYPTVQILYLMFWTGIERMGPQVGERFLVAYLRAARDYINAFEYGIDQDAIIDILTKETVIKDPAVFRQIKYAWLDPDGLVARDALEGDAELFRELGMMSPVDLSQAFDDRYRQFAVRYLGEYRPPQ
jgi:NitT/TauT family transport system substrate-binding protein